jgi:HK97 gp10 family phage protein
MNSGVVIKGVDHLIRKVEQMQTQIELNKVRAARAAANALKVVMKVEAPRGKHDVGKKGVGHLRASITVRQVAGGFTVGPRSPLAHLVIKGTVARHETAGQSTGGTVHQATLLSRRQLRFNVRGRQGPVIGQAQALMWSSGGQQVFRTSSSPGPMPKNPFVNRTLQLARGEATKIAGAVLFHNAPDINEGL